MATEDVMPHQRNILLIAPVGDPICAFFRKKEERVNYRVCCWALVEDLYFNEKGEELETSRQDVIGMIACPPTHPLLSLIDELETLTDLEFLGYGPPV